MKIKELFLLLTCLITVFDFPEIALSNPAIVRDVLVATTPNNLILDIDQHPTIPITLILTQPL